MLTKSADHWKTRLFSLGDVRDTAALKVDIKELSFDNVFAVCRSGRQCELYMCTIDIPPV